MLFTVRDSIPSQRSPAVKTAVIVSCAVVFGYQLMLGFALALWMKASGRVRPASARYVLWYRY